MIYHLMLVELKPKTSSEEIEELMTKARTRLLKVPEIYHVWCGKKIETAQTPHDLFIALDLQSKLKFESASSNPIFCQFMQSSLKPLAREITQLSFEMDPQKDVRYS